MASLLNYIQTWALTLYILSVFLIFYSHALFFSNTNPTPETLQISYFRPRVEKQEGYSFTNFANDVESFNKLHKKVVLDVCSNAVASESDSEYTWTFEDGLGTNVSQESGAESDQTQITKPPDVTSTNCQITWYAPYEGSYNVSVTIQTGSNIVARGSKLVDVLDIWFAAVGDSYMSGQGNPDKDRELFSSVSEFFGDDDVGAKWINAECYRSSYSHAFLLYEQLEKKYQNYGILFTFIACSGASIDTGFYSSHAGQIPQIEVIRLINQELKSHCPCDGCCKTVPDIFYQSLGANDLKFEPLVAGLISPLGDRDEMFQQLKADKLLLVGRIDRMDASHKCLQIPPQNVFYLEYFDAFRNEEGMMVTCLDVGTVTADDFKFLDKELLNDLNLMIRTSCDTFGWHYLDLVSEAFRTHGICAKDTFIRTIPESLRMQENYFGSFHPNKIGHVKVAEVVWQQMEGPVDEILDAYEKNLLNAWSKKYSAPVAISDSSPVGRRIAHRH